MKGRQFCFFGSENHLCNPQLFRGQNNGDTVKTIRNSLFLSDTSHEGGSTWAATWVYTGIMVTYRSSLLPVIPLEYLCPLKCRYRYTMHPHSHPVILRTPLYQPILWTGITAEDFLNLAEINFQSRIWPLRARGVMILFFCPYSRELHPQEWRPLVQTSIKQKNAAYDTTPGLFNFDPSPTGFLISIRWSFIKEDKSTFIWTHNYFKNTQKKNTCDVRSRWISVGKT